MIHVQVLELHYVVDHYHRTQLEMQDWSSTCPHADASIEIHNSAHIPYWWLLHSVVIWILIPVYV